MIDDHALDLRFRAPLRNRTVDLLLTINTVPRPSALPALMLRLACSQCPECPGSNRPPVHDPFHGFPIGAPPTRSRYVTIAVTISLWSRRGPSSMAASVRRRTPVAWRAPRREGGRAAGCGCLPRPCGWGRRAPMRRGRPRPGDRGSRGQHRANNAGLQTTHDGACPGGGASKEGSTRAMPGGCDDRLACPGPITASGHVAGRGRGSGGRVHGGGRGRQPAGRPGRARPALGRREPARPRRRPPDHRDARAGQR